MLQIRIHWPDWLRMPTPGSYATCQLLIRSNAVSLPGVTSTWRSSFIYLFIYLSSRKLHSGASDHTLCPAVTYGGGGAEEIPGGPLTLTLATAKGDPRRGPWGVLSWQGDVGRGRPPAPPAGVPLPAQGEPGPAFPPPSLPRARLPWRAASCRNFCGCPQ